MKSQNEKQNDSLIGLIRSLKGYIKRSIDEDGLIILSEKNSKEKSINSVEMKPNLEVSNKSLVLSNFYKEIKDCRLCVLYKTRKNFVFGDGDPEAKVVFIGEAPGQDEDEQGIPFVGRAGQLLTKIIEAINFKREEVFILNVLKCRPPNNRPPEPDEVKNCKPYLIKQLEIIKPLIICTLGNPATQLLLNTKQGITKMRGNVFEWNGMKVIPTYHPSACLRFPNYKKDVWQDVKLLRKEYDRLCRNSN